MMANDYSLPSHLVGPYLLVGTFDAKHTLEWVDLYSYSTYIPVLADGKL